MLWQEFSCVSTTTPTVQPIAYTPESARSLDALGWLLLHTAFTLKWANSCNSWRRPSRSKRSVIDFLCHVNCSRIRPFQFYNVAMSLYNISLHLHLHSTKDLNTVHCDLWQCGVEASLDRWGWLAPNTWHITECGVLIVSTDLHTLMLCGTWLNLSAVPALHMYVWTSALGDGITNS